MKRKIISVAAGIALALSAMPMFTVSAADMTISSVDEFKAFRDAVTAGNTYEGVTVTLTCDLDLNGSASNPWMPIGKYSSKSESGSFLGTFDGENHKISGLYINNSNADYQALFSGNKGTIKNLSVDGSVLGNTWTGGIVAVNAGTVSNCHYIGYVSGEGTVGGVVGQNGEVVGSGGKIINCCNEGKISGSDFIGGISGQNWGDDALVSGCFNKGVVTGNHSVGGVVGTSSEKVNNCYNTGSVTSKGDYSGGIVGCNGISGSKGGNNVYVSDQGIITNCYNIGNVTGSLKAGGVTGDNGVLFESEYRAITENCYYLKGTAAGGVNGADEAGAQSLTTVQLADEASFSGWDFVNTWTMSESLGRPILKAIPDDGSNSGSSSEPIPTPPPAADTGDVAPPSDVYTVNEEAGKTTFHMPYTENRYSSLSGFITITVYNSAGQRKASKTTSFSMLPTIDGIVTIDADVDCILRVGDMVRFSLIRIGNA